MAHSTRLCREAHATVAWASSHSSHLAHGRAWRKLLEPSAPCPFSTTAASQARLPYFHKKLTKNNPSASAATATTTTTTTPATQSDPDTTSPSKEKHTTASKDEQQPSMSNRQAFRSIVPDPHIMREIREQGLGENAQYWKFEGRSTNKTIQPGDKKLSREEFKAQQRAKRLPPRQIWFDTQTTKIVEKEQVQFPNMRFVAGAATVQSIPAETTLLRLARPYLFEELDSVNLLLSQHTPQQEQESRGDQSENDLDTQSLRHAIAPPTPEQLQQWRAKKREQELKLRDKALQEIAVVGRSNVGKSTLLNALTESPNTARVSNKPGLTRQLNFYRCGTGFVMVDMPGYGFAFANEADKQTWGELIETYVTKRKTLKRIYVMIDARHGLKVADREFLDLLNKGSTKFQIVLTKCDLVRPPDLARRYTTVLETLKKSYRNAVSDRLIMVSSYTGAGMNNLRKDILWVCNLDILVRERDRPESTIR